MVWLGWSGLGWAGLGWHGLAWSVSPAKSGVSWFALWHSLAAFAFCLLPGSDISKYFVAIAVVVAATVVAVAAAAPVLCSALLGSALLCRVCPAGIQLCRSPTD